MSFVTFLVGASYMEQYHYKLGFELEIAFSLRASSDRKLLVEDNWTKGTQSFSEFFPKST